MATPSSIRTRTALVDSSAFFALLDADDQHHGSARVVFGALADEGRPLLITNLIVAEVFVLVQGRLGPTQALAWLNALPSSQLSIVFATDSHHRQASELLNRYRDKLFSYADAVAFVVGSEEGVGSTFSYDDHFAQYAGMVGWELSR